MSSVLNHTDNRFGYSLFLAALTFYLATIYVIVFARGYIGDRYYFQNHNPSGNSTFEDRALR